MQKTLVLIHLVSRSIKFVTREFDTVAVGFKVVIICSNVGPDFKSICGFRHLAAGRIRIGRWIVASSFLSGRHIGNHVGMAVRFIRSFIQGGRWLSAGFSIRSLLWGKVFDLIALIGE